MRARRVLLPFVLAVSVVIGCGKAVFTEAVRDRYGLSRDDLRRVQFYTSDEIVLRRDLTAQEKARAGNALKIRDGVVIEEIVIPRHTACVVLRAEGEFLLAGFTPNHPEQSLWFSSKTNDDETVAADQKRFSLVALDNLPSETVPFEPRYATGFLVTYGGKKYQVADGKSWAVHLLYDIDETYANQKIEAKPPGWNLREGAPPAPPPVISATAAPSSSAPPSP